MGNTQIIKWDPQFLLDLTHPTSTVTSRYSLSDKSVSRRPVQLFSVDKVGRVTPYFRCV